MPIDMPPNNDLATQFKNNVELVSRYKDSKNFNRLDHSICLFDLATVLTKSNATSFEVRDSELNHSTWFELSEEDLDTVSKFEFKKNFKLKAKIIKISKYIPKIIID